MYIFKYTNPIYLTFLLNDYYLLNNKIYLLFNFCQITNNLFLKTNNYLIFNFLLISIKIQLLFYQYNF